MIKHVIFDLGQVLFAWEPRAALERYGFSATDAAIANERVFQHAVWNEVDRGTLSGDRAVQVFAERTGFSVKKMSEMLNVAWASLKPLDLGVELLKWVRAQGYGTYCISNMSVEMYQYLSERHVWLREFEDSVVSGFVKLIKPEAEIFEHALAKFRLSAPECLFIDDRPENVDAARRFGIHAVLYDSPSERVEQIKAMLCAER